MQSLAVSESPEVPRGNLFRYAWVALWAALFISYVLTNAPTAAARTAHGEWWVVTQGIDAFIMVLTMFVAVRLSRHYPLGRSQPPRHIGPHALAVVAFSLLWIIFYRVAPAIDHVSVLDPTLVSTQRAGELLGYLMCASIAHGIEYLRRYRESEAAAIRLRADVAETGRRRAEAELRALQAELNPHFLANALHSVSSLIRTDVGAANRALAELGDLLRSAISRVGTQEVTLGEEVDSLGPFIELERARFGDGLEVSWEVEDVAREARVPLMILQVLVDNALKHGFAKQRPARVRISAGREGASRDQLRVEVGCAGADLRAEASDLKHGDGTLAHVQARLRELYGPGVSLELATSPQHGAVARLTLPWRQQEEVPSHGEVDAPQESATELRRGASLPFYLSAFFIFTFALVAAAMFDTVTRSGVRYTLGAALASGLDGAIVLTVMLYVAIRITRSRKPAWRAHAIAAAVCGIALLINRIILPFLLGPPYRVAAPRRLLTALIGGPITYGLLAAIAYAAEYARRYRGSEAAGLQLRTELAEVAQRRAEAELRALKMELNPHFLGNSLAAVSSLARRDPDGAQRVLGELGDLLRGAVARIDVQEVTLGEEIKGLAPFLAVERARFGDRLVVSWDVDAATLDARVPHMILQPLVENAVKHGLSPRGGPGHIVVAGRRAGEKLELSVRDDGVGLNGHGSASDWRGGVGLTNARARLERLYGDEATLDLVAGPGVGTIARLILPWR